MRSRRSAAVGSRWTAALAGAAVACVLAVLAGSDGIQRASGPAVTAVESPPPPVPVRHEATPAPRRPRVIGRSRSAHEVAMAIGIALVLHHHASCDARIRERRSLCDVRGF